MPSLVDPLGRTIDYLRLSITDRCTLRCRYCMPPGGVSWIPHDQVMRFEQMLRICRILAGLGIGIVRVTGGEPLVRKGAVDLVERLGAIDGIKRVSLTSNGVLLEEQLPALAAAGLTSINISLDTLDEHRFSWLTMTDYKVNAISVIDRSLELGLDVKVNCVPMKGFNEDDIPALAALAKNRAIAVRFIEMMPLGAAAALPPLPADGVISLIEREHGPMRPSPVKLGYGPAVYYTLEGFTGYVGLISSVSHCFCDGCNRLRLTSTGILRPCLASDLGVDLAGMVRGGAADGEIADAVRGMVAVKPERHGFGLAERKQEHDNTVMYRIGG